MAPKKKNLFKRLRLRPKVKRKEESGRLMGTGRDCANTTLSCTDKRELMGSVVNPPQYVLCPVLEQDRP